MKKKLKILLDYDDYIPKYIINDPNRLRQVLINLLGKYIIILKLDFKKINNYNRKFNEIYKIGIYKNISKIKIK